MKNIFLYILVIVFFIIISFQSNKTGCVLMESHDSRPVLIQEEQYKLPVNVFKDGELIKFGVYSTGVKVGSGELHYKGVVAKNGREVQHVRFRVSTFSVSDVEDVYGTIDFLHPISVDRKVRVFGKDEVISEAYSDDKRSVVISKSVEGKVVEPQIIDLENELSNVLLLLYNLRNDKELQIGKKYEITLPTQNFDLFVKDTRKLKTSLGVFSAYYLESKPPKYRIWLSPEPDRIPLRIQGLVAGGMLYLVATETSQRD